VKQENTNSIYVYYSNTLLECSRSQNKTRLLKRNF